MVNKTFLKIEDICILLGISKATFWRLTKRPDFPKGKRISDRCRLWTKEEIVAFVEAQPVG